MNTQKLLLRSICSSLYIPCHSLSSFLHFFVLDSILLGLFSISFDSNATLFPLSFNFPLLLSSYCLLCSPFCFNWIFLYAISTLRILESLKAISYMCESVRFFFFGFTAFFFWKATTILFDSHSLYILGWQNVNVRAAISSL